MITSRKSLQMALFFLTTIVSLARGDRYADRLFETEERILDDRDGLSSAIVYNQQGDQACPCLPSNEHLKADYNFMKNVTVEMLGPQINASEYGISCKDHDVERPICRTKSDGCLTIIPTPLDCSTSWCTREWCYVDPGNCGRQYSRSKMFRSMYYSYATCGYMDLFTHQTRFNDLKGKTFNIALNANTGGWRGAYNPKGSFTIDQYWTGPIYRFIERAAEKGQFQMNFVKPPESLKDESKEFYGISSFDYCVYVTVLGYVDFCVSGYTITSERSATANFFHVLSDPIYMIAFKSKQKSSWKVFGQAFGTIFRPFTRSVWFFLFFFLFPVLGILMLFHEYNTPGGTHSSTTWLMVIDNNTNQCDVRSEPIPWWKHGLTAIYMSYLAFFQESYNQSVFTLGGKINLLAMSSLIMLVLAVYTANLAAILTQEYSSTGVESLEDAIRKNYVFCASRQIVENVISVHSELTPDRFVPDPVELGGDGRFGFTCPKCNARERVFDFMSLSPDKDPSLYCDAALASLEDLEVLHGRGLHCDKTQVGDVIASRSVGIPIFDQKSDALISFFQKIKNEGVLDKEMQAAMPKNVCPNSSMGEEGNPLSMQQLTGIWMITFTFAGIGILTKLLHPCSKRRQETKNCKKKIVRDLMMNDQWGNPSSHSVEIDGVKFDRDSKKLEATTRRGRSYRYLNGTREKGVSPSLVRMAPSSLQEYGQTKIGNNDAGSLVLSEEKSPSSIQSVEDGANVFADDIQFYSAESFKSIVESSNSNP